jgi:hypothetical protein
MANLGLSAAQILGEVQALLSNRDKWTSGFYARDAKGDRVSALDVRATCWCLTGAFDKVTGIDEDNDFFMLYHLLFLHLLLKKPKLKIY